MKILFITHPYPNYVPDLLLHGLRKLVGPDVVDYPRKECLYRGVLGLGVCPEDQLCPGWFPPDEERIDRQDIVRKIRTGFFQYIVCDVRALARLGELPEIGRGLVLIDGEDRPFPIRPGKYVVCRRETDGSDFSIPLPMALPEEILHWITAYDDLPKKYTIGFLGSTQNDKRRMMAEAIASSYPDVLLQTSRVPTDSDPRPSGRFSRDQYYRMLQQCRIVLSLSGAGHDTFRFWENAACNAVHAAPRFPLYIPSDFRERRHLFRFTAIDELFGIIDSVLEEKVPADEVILDGRYHLVRHHLTTRRAAYFLEKLRHADPV